MAARKSTSKKRSSSAKGKKTSGRKGSRSKADENDIPEGLYEEVGLLLLLGVSVVLILGNFGLTSVFGDTVNSFFFGLFGFMEYIWPFLLFFGTVFYLGNRNNIRALIRLAACAAIFVLGGMYSQLFSSKEFHEAGYSGLYDFSAATHRGGGVIFGSIYEGAAKGIGVVGAVALMLVLTIICIVMLTGKSFISILRYSGRKMADRAEQSTEEWRKDRAAAREERELIRAERSREKAERRQREREEHLREVEERVSHRERIPDLTVGEGRKRSNRLTPVAGEPLEVPFPQDLDEFDTEQVDEDESVNAYSPFAMNPSNRVKPVFDDKAEELSESDNAPDIDINRIDKEDDRTQDADSNNEAKGADVYEDGFFDNGLSTFRVITPVSHENESYEAFEEISRGAELDHTYEDDETYSSDDEEDRFYSSDETNDEYADDESDTGIHDEYDEFSDEEDETDRSDVESHVSKPQREIRHDMHEILLDDEDDYYSDDHESENIGDEPEESETDEYTDSIVQYADDLIKSNGKRKIAPIEENDPRDGVIEIPAYEHPKAIYHEEAMRPDLSDEEREIAGFSKNTEKSAEQKMVQEPEKKKLPPKPYVFPGINLLTKGKPVETESRQVLDETAKKLVNTLASFNVRVKLLNVIQGPSVTRYEMQPEQGVKVNKILSLADDIQLNLAAMDIRIEAPIPGKAAIGIEIPNSVNQTVMFRDLIERQTFQNAKSKLSFAVGKNIGGEVVVFDIAKMPHLLIAGATGSGKSVCINTIIMSILYKAKPDEVKLIMIDPKVVELSVYNGLPHLLTPVVTDPQKAAGALKWGVAEMDRRYQLFARARVRNMQGYNEIVPELNRKGETRADGSPYEILPQIVIIVDELADLMMVAKSDVESSICRLAQLARAAGIHLIIATQRPSVDVITGLIKANMPSRIAFAVSSGVDSRTILDMVGAEKLLGKGDMLFYPQGYSKPERIQGAFITDDEVQNVVNFITGENTSDPEAQEEITAAIEAQSASSDDTRQGDSGETEPEDDRDQYFSDAGRFIIETNKASIGKLQRKFKIGFNRAARIMDQLAEAGVVTGEDGTKARQILMTAMEFENYLNGGHDEI